MYFQTINWSTLPRELPVTTGLITIMTGLWLTYQLGLIPPHIILPGTWELSAWTGHLFHIDLMHLIGNAFSALMVGMFLERALHPWRYALILGLVWQLIVILLFYLGTSPMLGFSAVGLGVMTFTLGAYWERLDVRQLLLCLIGLNLLIGLLPGISGWGHLWGAAAGGLVWGLLNGLPRILKNK